MSKVAWYGLGLLVASGSIWIADGPPVVHIVFGVGFLGWGLLRGDR